MENGDCPPGVGFTPSVPFADPDETV